LHALPVFSLSIHADYRCRHSGACCAMEWDVPIELPVYRSLDAAVAEGRLRPSAAAQGLVPFVVTRDDSEVTAAIFERTDGGCVFFDGSSRLCIVHRDLGEPYLPATCRYFPRLSVQDPRGTFVTLSHFCPTAASLLFREDVALEIVSQPPAFPHHDYDGLTVGPDDLPPLLHPRMLMDLDAYTAWERHMVARCADEASAPESVLATLARDAADLRRWRPGAGRLVDAVERLTPEPVAADPPETLAASLAVHAETLRAVPPELMPDPDDGDLETAYVRYVADRWPDFRPPLNRYLAGKCFASWTAYQGRGVTTIVRGVDVALGLVRVEAARRCRDAARPLDAALLLEAFRAADFLLNHLAVGEDLAQRWSDIEQHWHS
jgi:hypothetical protein